MIMSRQLSIRLRLMLLALLLVLDQQGALLHELGHLSHGAGAAAVTLHAEEHATDGLYCPTCEAFAQIANPASGAVHTVPVCPAAFLPTPDPCYSIADSRAPRPRSRGPPQA
jgi:hypothetical protein